MITGVSHVTFGVSDLERSLGFYVGLLGARLVARGPGEAHLIAGDAWIALVVDGGDAVSPSAGYSHVAFSLRHDDLEPLRRRVEEAGASLWQENRTEGDSLYLCDPDGHKLELHVGDLDSRLDWARRQGGEGWTFFD